MSEYADAAHCDRIQAQVCGVNILGRLGHQSLSSHGIGSMPSALLHDCSGNLVCMHRNNLWSLHAVASLQPTQRELGQGIPGCHLEYGAHCMHSCCKCKISPV
jgi:hypothetical protein